MQFMEDLRFAFRQIRRAPGFAAFIIATLAIGIGANTTIFGAVNAFLLRPLPWADSDRLVNISGEYKDRGDDWSVSLPNALDWGGSQVFETSGYWQSSTYTLAGPEQPVRIPAVRVSPSLLTALGAKPVIGRLFTQEEADPQSERVVLLSYGAWQNRFGGDRGVLGRAITLSGNPWTVIGVLPASFAFPHPTIELYTPVRANQNTWNRASGGLSVIGKLRKGLSVEDAQRELDAVSARLAQEYPGTNQELKGKIKSLRQDLYGGSRIPLLLYTLFGAVALVLMIACVNVANLLLARATGREREIAVRTAIGASRRRVVGQLLTESMVLSVMGAIGGVLFSLWGTRLLLGILPADVLPQSVGMDGGVLIFTAAVTIVTGLLFGLAPAVHASRTDLTTLIGGRSGAQTRRRTRARATLVVAQVALAAVLLITAGLMIRSLQSLMRRDPGFHAANLLTMRVTLDATYNDQTKTLQFQQQALERLRSLPGVEAAGAADWLPLAGTNNYNDVSLDDRPLDQRENVGTVIVTPGYLEAMRIPLVRGRRLDDRDVRAAPGVAVVNQAFVRKYSSNRDPIGRRILFNWDGGEKPYWRTVVGVVGDVRHHGLDEDLRTEVYIPFAQLPWYSNTMAFVLRSRGEPASLIEASQAAIWSIDRNQAIYDTQTMREVIRESGSVAYAQLMARSIGTFGTIALLLAALGLYGVISYGVAQRTYEIGVRGALGATRMDVVKLIVGQGLTLVCLGLVLGLLGAVASLRITRSMLFGINAFDPVSFAQAIAVLLSVALLATVIPARRAARIDPSVALKAE